MKLVDLVMKIITYVFVLLISVIVVFILYSFISINLLQRDYVSVLGYTYFEVASGSMEPTINKGDMVIVKLGDQYYENNIVTYALNGDFITHRVIQLNSNTLVTKGDANNTKDAMINKDSVIGRVVFIVPKFGIWRRVFMTPKVLVIFLICLTLFSFTFSYNNKEKRRKLKNQRKRRLEKERGVEEDIPIILKKDK